MTRVRQEDGFGMLELLMAIVVLNIGLFAIIGAMSATSASIGRAKFQAAALAVADKQMEIYRGTANCAIWLDQWLMPASNSVYAADLAAYNGTAAFTPTVPYWNAAGAADSQLWATDGMDSSNGYSQINLASCAYTSQTAAGTLPLTSTTGSLANIGSLNFVTPVVSSTDCGTTTTIGCPIKPAQTIAGPDGQLYTVYTYIILVQPTSGEYTKQVTITVRDPKNVNLVLARESSVFDPTVAQ